jgi:hypothetical protein
MQQKYAQKALGIIDPMVQAWDIAAVVAVSNIRLSCNCSCLHSHHRIVVS